MTGNVIIRREQPQDWRDVENLVRDSFWNVYRPGCLEHYVLKKLRSSPAFVSDLDFVLENDGRIIGQNVFVKAGIAADDGRMIPILAISTPSDYFVCDAEPDSFAAYEAGFSKKEKLVLPGQIFPA